MRRWIRFRERQPVTTFLAPLRDGYFLTRQRLTVYPILLIVGFAVAIVWLIVTAHGVIDYAGQPLGTDFSNIYAAGVATLKGDATAPFDIMRQWRQEQAIFGQATPLYGWHYPPFFLLVAAPLAYLPYLAALALWQLSTLALYLWALAALIRKSAMPEGRGLAMAHTCAWLHRAVFVNRYGHNGFLTAALFAGAAFAIRRIGQRAHIRQAGMFGLLAYKPQFG